MDPESVIMVADGSEPALVNGGLTMESVGIEVNGFASGETLDATSEIQNENSGDSSTLDAIEHSKEFAAEVGNWMVNLLACQINGFVLTFFFFCRVHKLKM